MARWRSGDAKAVHGLPAWFESRPGLQITLKSLDNFQFLPSHPGLALAAPHEPAWAQPAHRGGRPFAFGLPAAGLPPAGPGEPVATEQSRARSGLRGPLAWHHRRRIVQI